MSAEVTAPAYRVISIAPALRPGAMLEMKAIAGRMRELLSRSVHSKPFSVIAHIAAPAPASITISPSP